MLFRSGYAYHRLNRDREAVEQYRQAVRLKPDYSLAHYNLGISYIKMGNRNGAMEEYRILQRLDQDQARKLYGQIK